MTQRPLSCLGNWKRKKKLKITLALSSFNILSFLCAMETKWNLHKKSSFVALSIIALFAQYFFFLLWLKQCWGCKNKNYKNVGEFSMESWGLRRRVCQMALGKVRRFPLEKFCDVFRCFSRKLFNESVEKTTRDPTEGICCLSSLHFPVSLKQLPWMITKLCVAIVVELLEKSFRLKQHRKKVIIRRCNRKGKTVCREPCWNEVERKTFRIWSLINNRVWLKAN